MVKTTNETFTGTGPAILNINTYSRIFYVSVQGANISVSINNGAKFFTLPAGIHELRLGFVSVMYIRGTGTWQIIATEEAFEPDY